MGLPRGSRPLPNISFATAHGGVGDLWRKRDFSLDLFHPCNATHHVPRQALMSLQTHFELQYLWATRFVQR
jgi:hypothetical protein